MHTDNVFYSIESRFIRIIDIIQPRINQIIKTKGETIAMFLIFTTNSEPTETRGNIIKSTCSHRISKEGKKWVTESHGH